MFPKLGDMLGILGLLKLLLFKLKVRLKLIDGSSRGTANTAVEFHAGRCMALVENDHPYVVKLFLDGQMETLGRYSYGGKLDHPFTGAL